MRSPDDKRAREEETIGETASGSYASRKGRLTPRQMWARQARRRAKARVQTADEEPIEEDVPTAAGLGEDMEPLATSVGEEPQENEDLQYDDETIIEVIEEDSDDDSPDDAEILEVIEDDMDDEELEAEEAEEKAEPVMVDASMQPGAMKYPYATHRPAPDTPKTEKEPLAFERRISSGFVVGIVVVAFALILGLSIVGQRRRISALEDRVQELETVVPSPSGQLVVGR